MGLSGKYDFKGIKKVGSAGIKAALSASPYTAWLLKFGAILDLGLEFGTNWLANNGLIVFNIGAFYVKGELDQKALDNAIEAGLKKIQQSNGNLTPEQIKEIDDAVIKAANQALPYGSVSNP